MAKTTKQNNNLLTSNDGNGTIEAKVNKKSSLRERRKRIPLREQRRLLDIPDKDPNFVYRLVNDVNNRISSMRDSGYEIIDRTGQEIEDFDVRIQDSASKNSALCQSVGSGITAYVMRKPKEWYDEDKEKELEEIKKKEKATLTKDEGGKEIKDLYGEIKISR